MPLYEVLETSYINDRLVQAGSIIDYTPPKGLKPPPGATDEQKSLPHYKDTIVGPNLKPASKAADVFEIPADMVSKVA